MGKWPYMSWIWVPHRQNRGSVMKVAEKVILLLDGGDGFAATISASLHPDPSSNLQTINVSFELSLERYGIKNQKSSGEAIHFVDSHGNFEVSTLILQNYEPPVLVCALNELLLELTGDDLSSMPRLIIPFILSESKLKLERNYSPRSDKALVYCTKLGPTTDVTETLSSCLQKTPPSSQIYHEGLATLLQLINVMKLPAVVLIGVTGQQVSNKNPKDKFEVICRIGDHLASTLSLSFSKEKAVMSPSTTSKDSKEAWRALYG